MPNDGLGWNFRPQHQCATSVAAPPNHIERKEAVEESARVNGR